MTTVAAIDWNLWRANYDLMTFRQHQDFYADVAAIHPEQNCWNKDATRKFVNSRRPREIVEVGGWNGSLANAILREFPQIDTWVNYEIAPDVPQECTNGRYTRVTLADWPWHRKLRADALIASHVFEHMRITEIEKLVQAWDVASIYIDCPIGPDAPNWDGYEGSHILEVGSTELLARLKRIGYRASFVDAGADSLIAYLDRAEDVSLYHWWKANR